MALKHAPFCTRCGKRRTKSETGLCSVCRKNPHPASPCRCCGVSNTSHETGLCYRCRTRPINPIPLADAIATYKKTLAVLELRQSNRSFGDISKSLGIPKPTVYAIYRTSLHLPDWAKSIKD